MVLRIRDRWLLVLSRRSKEILYRVRLQDLEDVMLDTSAIKIVSFVRDRALAHVETRLGPEVDVTRIVLVPSGDGPVFPLTCERTAYQDGIEAMARVRCFLREHGWVPADEHD